MAGLRHVRAAVLLCLLARSPVLCVTRRPSAPARRAAQQQGRWIQGTCGHTCVAAPLSTCPQRHLADLLMHSNRHRLKQYEKYLQQAVQAANATLPADVRHLQLSYNLGCNEQKLASVRKSLQGRRCVCSLLGGVCLDASAGPQRNCRACQRRVRRGNVRRAQGGGAGGGVPEQLGRVRRDQGGLGGARGRVPAQHLRGARRAAPTRPEMRASACPLLWSAGPGGGKHHACERHVWIKRVVRRLGPGGLSAPRGTARPPARAQANRLLRPSALLLDIADRFIQAHFAASKGAFVAIHLRPYPDECLLVSLLFVFPLLPPSLGHTLELPCMDDHHAAPLCVLGWTVAAASVAHMVCLRLLLRDSLLACGRGIGTPAWRVQEWMRDGPMDSALLGERCHRKQRGMDRRLVPCALRRLRAAGHRSLFVMTHPGLHARVRDMFQQVRRDAWVWEGAPGLARLIAALNDAGVRVPSSPSLACGPSSYPTSPTTRPAPRRPPPSWPW